MDADTLRLSQIEVLRDLSRQEILAIERRCRMRRYARGQQVIDHQASDRDVYFVIAGTVRVTVYAPSGRQVTFADIDAGGCFGDLSAIDGRPRSASVVALSEAQVASMPSQLFWEVIREQPAFAAAMLRRLADMVRRLDDRIVELSTLGVQNRIHAELLRLAHPDTAHPGAAVIAPIPRHADIASRIATNREAVTRELNHLVREGILARQAGQLVIHDIARLARMIDRSRTCRR